jgi:hypothetical protein
MTFEAAVFAALTTLGMSTDVPIDRMSTAWAPRFTPHTINGEMAAAWAYDRNVIAIGVNIEWDQQADDWTRRFVASHEACHLKLHMKWIKMPAHKIPERQMILNELEADHCAIWVMGVQAGNE